MSFSGIFYLNSAPVQEHDFLAAPSDFELQQVPDAAFPLVHAANGAHVPGSSLTNPVIPNEALRLPGNSAPPDLATEEITNLAIMALPAESEGVTVPTAETAADGADVEDGVEVLSTPHEPFVGMSFNTSDACYSL